MIAPNMPSTTTTEDVPPIMHMVWFGSPTPEHISRVWDTWEKELPRGWRLERWDDERIREDSLLMAVVKSFPELTPRGTADMLRLWIISTRGGVYMDSDALPMRDLDSLANRPAWIGSSPTTDTNRVLINAFFGMPKQHPFLAHAYAMATHQYDRGVRNDHYVAGPQTFRRAHNSAPEPRPELDRGFVLIHTAQVKGMARGDRPIDTEALRQRIPEYKVVHP